MKKNLSQFWEKIEFERKKKRKEEILAANYKDLSYERLKERIKFEQDEKCNKCTNHEWLGEPLVLEVDHKDGDRQNNKRENLEALCPNCHSTTKTWRGRNSRKKERVGDKELLSILIECGWNMRQALLKAGMVDKGGNYKRCHRLKNEYIEHGGVIEKVKGRTSKLPKKELAKKLAKQNLQEIADEIGWSFSSVRRWAIEYGIHLSTSKGRTDLQDTNRKCLVCENEFTPKRIEQKCCSQQCAQLKSAETNRKRRETLGFPPKPDKETLKRLLAQKTWTSIGNIYGVSDNAVRKWAKKYDLI